jgi:hypothetical protein
MPLEYTEAGGSASPSATASSEDGAGPVDMAGDGYPGPSESGPPAEVLRMVMTYLEPRDMGRIACTSRQGGMLMAGEESVWKAFCYRDFGILHRADRCSWLLTYRKGWTEKVLFFMGQPDYVEYLGSVQHLQPRRLKACSHTPNRGSAEAA